MRVAAGVEWRQACCGTWLMLWESEICDEREKRGEQEKKLQEDKGGCQQNKKNCGVAKGVVSKVAR